MTRSRWAAVTARGLLVLALAAAALGISSVAASTLEFTAPDLVPFVAAFDCTSATTGDGACPAPSTTP